MEDKINCEHELILINEHWICVQAINVILECKKCNKRFEGILFEK